MSDATRFQSGPRTGAMRCLLWKDFGLVKSLSIGAMIAVFGLFGLLVVLKLYQRIRIDEAIVSLWIALPNLVALGLPPMLIGTENETRSLDWLHGLPVSWRKVLLSKVLVSLAVWLGTLIAATILLFFISWISHWQGVLLWRGSVVGSGVWDQRALVTNLVYGGILLLVGMIWSLLIRSPLVSTLMVLPSMFFGVGVAAFFDRYLHTHRSSLLGPSIGQTDAGVALAIFLVGVVLIGLTSIVAILGRRRLSGYSDEPWWNVRKLVRPIPSPLSHASATVPLQNAADLSNVDVGGAAWWPNPTVWSALLWQQWIQIRWPWMAATVLGIVGSFFSLFSLLPGERVFAPATVWSFLSLWVSQTILGTLCFYGDRRKSRLGFFANFGISPTLVWITRVLPCAMPSLAVVLLTAGLMWSVRSSVEAEYWPMTWFVGVGGQCFAFAIAMAAGQWTARSTLSFFVAPILMYLYAVCMILVMLPYTSYLSWAWLALPFWWLATWRLTRIWMESGRGLAVWGRGIGYASLGLLCVTIGVYANRFADIPEQQTQWQSQMRSIRWSDEPALVLPEINGALMIEGARGDVAIELAERIQRELDDDQWIGRSVLRADLVDAMQSPETDRLALEVALKWANVVRTRVIAGQSGLRELQIIAEWAEALAVDRLLSMTANPPTTELNLNRWVAMIPSDESRNESRRRAVIAAWQQFDSDPWFQEKSGVETSKTFAGRSFDSQQLKTFIERLRAERLIDVAVRTTLDELSSGLPSIDSPGHQAAVRRWQQPFQVEELAKDQKLFEKQLLLHQLHSPSIPVFSSNLQSSIHRLRAATSNKNRTLNVR